MRSRLLQPQLGCFQARPAAARAAAAAARRRRLAHGGWLAISSLCSRSQNRGPHSAAGLILVQQDDPPQIRIQLGVVSPHVLSMPSRELGHLPYVRCAACTQAAVLDMCEWHMGKSTACSCRVSSPRRVGSAPRPFGRPLDGLDDDDHISYNNKVQVENEVAGTPQHTPPISMRVSQ